MIKLKEHQNFPLSPEEHELEGINNKSEGKNFCGIYYDWENNKQVLKTGYFIGACWLEENELALQIEPKIDIDFMQIFMDCFKHPIVAKELSEIYDIDFNKPKIQLESDSLAEITPLLIFHFLQVVHSIVQKGIKKGYYPKAENLNAKVKGKINIKNTLKHNVFKMQNHKTFCDFTEFGLDCMENRLLKLALIFVQSYLAKLDNEKSKNAMQTLNYCLAAFELVSDKVDTRDVENFKNNTFFREYFTAIKLAKMILKYFSFNLKNTEQKKLTPPFYIDMSLLFELYVYTKLLENNQVNYQAKGKYGNPDFLIDDMIVDTKYKPKYRNMKGKKNEYGYKIEDIRQLSGYGRDKKIREKLGLTDTDAEIAKCLIIYPNKNSEESFGDNLWNDAEEINQFVEFRKLAIKLPTNE